MAAAELALSRSTPTEAGHCVEAGLAQVLRLADGPSRQSLELSLLLARANALLPLKGYNAPETVAALTAAKRVLVGIGVDLQRFSVLNGLCLANYMAAQMEAALALARQIVEVADRQDDTTYRLIGYRLLGTIQFFMGRQREALVSLQQAEQYRDPSRQKMLSYRFGYDPGLAVMCYKIWTLLFLGLHDQAAQVSKQVRDELPGHGHAPTVAICNFFADVWPELLLGDFEACELHSAELIAYCANKMEQFRLLGSIYHALARAAREPTQDNIAAIYTAIAAERQSGSRVEESYYGSRLAEALLAAGDVVGARTALQEAFAFAFVEQSGERFWLADLHRVAGQISLKRPEPDWARAEACFRQAIEIARSREARFLELRAATDLAQLWRDTGSNSDPRVLVEPILTEIEGGETMRDVRKARSLLAEFT